MEENQRALLIKVSLIAGPLLVLGALGYFFYIRSSIKIPSSTSTPTPVSSSGLKVGEPLNDQRPPLVQLNSLEGTKTAVPIIVVPAISGNSNISQSELPKLLSGLISADSVGISASIISYADKTNGYKIQFSLKKILGAVVTDFLNGSKNNGWKIVTTLKSTKAALADMDNDEFKVHVTFLQTTDTDTSIRIWAIAK